MINNPIILITFLIVFLNPLNNQLIAQTDNIYDDLLVLLVNEEYKDCYNKSIKYTVKEKTKKESGGSCRAWGATSSLDCKALRKTIKRRNSFWKYNAFIIKILLYGCSYNP